MALRPQYFDVLIERRMDGHRIKQHHRRLTADDVVVLRWEQECLPGTFTFEKRAHRRPWDAPASTQTPAISSRP